MSKTNSAQCRTVLIPAILILLGTVLSLSNAPASAAAADTYSIQWYTADGGGAMWSTGGTYSLGGTVGQPDAGAQSGGTYTQSGGFWVVDVSGYMVTLPLITR